MNANTRLNGRFLKGSLEFPHFTGENPSQKAPQMSSSTCRSWNQKAGGSLGQLRLPFPGHIHLPGNRFLRPLTSTRVSQVIHPAARSTVETRLPPAGSEPACCRDGSVTRRAAQPRTVGARWLLCCCCCSSSVCTSLHLLPVLPVNRCCVKPQGINPFGPFPSRTSACALSAQRADLESVRFLFVKAGRAAVDE